MYAKIVDGVLIKFPYSIEEMRETHPDLEIGDEPTPEQLTACNAVPAQQDWTPTKSSRTHTFEPIYSENEDGSVTISYRDVEKPLQIAEFNMRDARDSALTRCDWVITRAFEEGNAVPANYLTYRQALRDLPSQEGFPYEYVWPVLGE